MATETEIAWAAGLFEGEGCLTISNGRQKNGTTYRQPRLKVISTDQDTITRFAEIVEVGQVRREHGQERLGYKLQYEWYTGRKSSVKTVIELLYPWLGERRKMRADELLKVIET